MTTSQDLECLSELRSIQWYESFLGSKICIKDGLYHFVSKDEDDEKAIMITPAQGFTIVTKAELDSAVVAAQDQCSFHSDAIVRLMPNYTTMVSLRDIEKISRPIRDTLLNRHDAFFEYEEIQCAIVLDVVALVGNSVWATMCNHVNVYPREWLSFSEDFSLPNIKQKSTTLLDDLVPKVENLLALLKPSHSPELVAVQSDIRIYRKILQRCMELEEEDWEE